MKFSTSSDDALMRKKYLAMMLAFKMIECNAMFPTNVPF